MRGYPAWPAKVVKQLNDGKYAVIFFGTLETANVQPTDIWPYDTPNTTKFCNEKIMARPLFMEGMEQMKQALAKYGSKAESPVNSMDQDVASRVKVGKIKSDGMGKIKSGRGGNRRRGGKVARASCETAYKQERGEKVPTLKADVEVKEVSLSKCRPAAARRRGRNGKVGTGEVESGSSIKVGATSPRAKKEVEVPEDVTVERGEKDVKVPEVAAEEGVEITAVESREKVVEVPKVLANSKTQMSRKRKVGGDDTPGSAKDSKKRVRFSRYLMEVVAEEGEELNKRGERPRQGIRVLLPKGDSELDTEEEVYGSSPVDTLHCSSLGGGQEQEDTPVKSPLRPAIPCPARNTDGTLSDSPLMGSQLPAPANPLLGNGRGQSLGNLSPASLPSTGYKPRSG